MLPYVNIHTHKPGGNGISILDVPIGSLMPEYQYISSGVHPWYINEKVIENQMTELKKQCLEKKLVAIGETGIDRVIQIPVDIQTDVFEKQADLAEKFKLPLIIHCVKAWSDLLGIRKKGKYTVPWIFHGYNGNLQTAGQIIDSGCFLSFGKALIDNKKASEVFRQLSVSKIFLETDDSNYKIEEIYNRATILFEMAEEELKSVLYDNFINLFSRH